jgi:phenylacetate-CoA ligase
MRVRRVADALDVVRLLPAQHRIPFLPRQKIAALRDARIRDIVRYAAETVPHYRDLFARQGIDPREIRSAAELRQLPLIDKRVVLEDPERFRSTAPEAEDTVRLTTSGSSWIPLTIHHDRRSVLRSIAYSERYRMVERRLVGKHLRWVVATIAHETLTGRTVRAHHDTTGVGRFLSNRHWIPVEAPVESVLAQIAQIRPDVLTGFGSYIEALYRLVARRGLEIYRPKLVRYGGDAMSAEGRELIEARFGIPVVSNYNAVEAFEIGYTCERRRGYHLCEDLTDLWIAGPDDRPCPAGELGEVVISNLVNRATVLLNYRLGDFARLSDEQCSCGRTSTMLSAVEGRVSELIHLASGDIVHPFAFLPVVRRHREVIRSQLVQHEPARFELRVTTGEPQEFEEISNPLARELSDVLGGAVVEVAYDDSLTSRPGKHVPVVPLRT